MVTDYRCQYPSVNNCDLRRSRTMGTLTAGEIKLLESQAEGEESLVISKAQPCPEWPGIIVTLNYFLAVVKAKIGHDQVRRLCVDCRDTKCPANLTGQNIDNQIRSSL